MFSIYFCKTASKSATYWESWEASEESSRTDWSDSGWIRPHWGWWIWEWESARSVALSASYKVKKAITWENPPERIIDSEINQTNWSQEKNSSATTQSYELLQQRGNHRWESHFLAEASISVWKQAKSGGYSTTYKKTVCVPATTFQNRGYLGAYQKWY